METGNEIKTISLSVVIAFLIGAVVAMLADPYLPSPLSNTQKGYQNGFNAAKTLVASSSVGGFFQTPADVRTLSGTVTAISGNRITFHVQSSNPFDDPSLANRTAIVDASTTVIRLAQKDPVVYQAEMDAFTKAQKTATTTGILPTPTVVASAQASDIKIGDMINVLTLVNVKTLGEFTVRAIQILPKPTPLLAQ